MTKIISFLVKTVASDYTLYPIRPMPRVFFSGWNEMLNGYGNLAPKILTMSNGDTAITRSSNIYTTLDAISMTQFPQMAVFYEFLYPLGPGVDSGVVDALWHNTNNLGRTPLAFLNDVSIHKPKLKKITLEYQTLPAFQNDGKDGFENVGYIWVGHMQDPFNNKYDHQQISIKEFIDPSNYSNKNALIRVEIPIEMELNGSTLLGIDGCSFPLERNQLQVNLHF